ncbi:hypothetical protein K466DRAFT_602247 [Polyporus arcularius HHB13444]|uniref:Uncharacterized protein n=1 Tax=Polyporus arcularius HHB13444 TaxID=1314778 RepID=A0A5C3P3B9_9APHY|nr:hypothetical protein K466DRAFT_602247 [Polyporus arcularius HHB13444]
MPPASRTEPSDTRSDLTPVLNALAGFLSTAARSFGGGRVPDIVHFTDITVRLCLEVPMIRALPFEERRDVIHAVARYMVLLAVPLVGSSTTAEQTTSTVRQHTQEPQPAGDSDAWVSPQGTYIAHSRDPDVYHLGSFMFSSAR